MPMILGITVLFLYIAMFAHDRCAIEYICQTSCAKSVYEPDHRAIAEETAENALSGKLILEWDTDVSAEETKEALILTIYAKNRLYDRVYRHTATAYKHFCPKY